MIDENGDGTIIRSEWQPKLQLVMKKVKHINTNFTLDEFHLWKEMGCNNSTNHTIDMNEFETLLNGEDQCGEELDYWFRFALNVVVSLMDIVN